MYGENLRNSLRFEDFVYSELLKDGIAVVRYGSKEYQSLVGENAAGFEVKLDRKMADTGNVFIETAERHNDSVEWKPSGICKSDNTWLYIIGNFDRFYVFGRRMLRRMYHWKTGDVFRYERKETATARGFLVQCVDADCYAERIIERRTEVPVFTD